MGKKKIIIDTNIIVSAYGWEGKEKEILRHILDEKYLLITCKEQIEELRRVLDYPKLYFTSEEKLKLLGIIYSMAEVIEIPGNLKVVKEDPDDNIILESALIGKANYIVTGDHHLLNLREYSGIMIVNSSDFLQLI